jgi:hypothetical protein
MVGWHTTRALRTVVMLYRLAPRGGVIGPSGFRHPLVGTHPSAVWLTSATMWSIVDVGNH